MYSEAKNMNLFETSFGDVTGLDIDATTPGAVGSAENVATMLQNIYFDDTDIVDKTAFQSFNIYSKNGIIHKAQNTNIVAGQIVGFLGSKTGLTNIAGGNIAFAMNVGLNHAVFVSILGSTEDGRFDDALLISKAIINSFSN
jgi:D-alanyl-D-alanine carboxypeptidase